MYKALKDEKIIAISDLDNEFPCLVKDNVVEDTEHNIDDYDQYNGEYLLKSEIPAPTKEEQQAKRKVAYEKDVDELHSQKLRHQAIGDWTEEDEAEYKEKVVRLSEEIAERYPYPTDPITEKPKEESDESEKNDL